MLVKVQKLLVVIGSKTIDDKELEAISGIAEGLITLIKTKSQCVEKQKPQDNFVIDEEDTELIEYALGSYCFY